MRRGKTSVAAVAILLFSATTWGSENNHSQANPLASESRALVPGHTHGALRQSGEMAGARAALDSLALEQKNAPIGIHRARGVTQPEAEVLLIGAQAGLYLSELQEAWIASGDGLASAREWVEEAKQKRDQGLSVSATGHSLEKVQYLGPTSLASFLDEIGATFPGLAEGVWGPYVLIVPVAVAAPSPTEHNSPQALPDVHAQTTIFSETFESNVWDRWWRYDDQDGNYTWGQTSCDKHGGGYSVDAVRGGTYGAGMSCTQAYPSNIDSWLRSQRCINVQGASSAWIEGYVSINVEPGYDYLDVLFDRGDLTFFGYRVFGFDTRWWLLRADMKRWWYLGDLTRMFCNGLMFAFHSDESETPGHGARLDDIRVLTNYTPGQTCSISASALSGPTPLTVSFSPMTTGFSGTAEYYWEFGDDSNSLNKEPVHTFSQLGYYPVALRVTEANTRCGAGVVIAAGSPCSISCNASVPSQGYAGYPVTLQGDATENCAYLSASYRWWVYLPDSTPGTTNKDMTLTFPQPGTYHWEFTAVTDDDAGDPYCYQTGTIQIIEGAPCTFSLSPASQSFSSDGGSGSVSVNASAASCSWSASSSVSWVTVTGGFSGTGNGTVSYSVAPNSGTSSRSGTLSIAGQTFTVTQSGATPCTYSISPTSQSFASNAGTGSVSVAASAPSCVWSASSNASWISITGGAAGTGSGTVMYSVAANASTSARTGSLTVAGQTFSVTQSGSGSGSGSFRYLIPAIAHAPGANNTSWRSDVSVVNRSGSSASVTVSYNSTSSGMTGSYTFSLPNGVSATSQDILTSLFGLSPSGGDKGTIQIRSTTAVCAVGRTYNQAPTGTFGQAYPAVAIGDAISAGRIALLPHLSNNAAYRTNIGMVNVGTGSCSVTVRLYGSTGAQLGSAVYIAADPGKYQQIDRVFEAAGAGIQDMAYATVSTESSGCSFWAFAAVVDNSSGDPTTIDMIPQ